MAGAEQIRLQQFEVAALAAPPALLCQQLLQTSIGQHLQTDLLLRQNPALLLRVLDAQFKLRKSAPGGPLEARLAQLDGEWLHALLSDMSLQLVLRGGKGSYLFHLLYWQEARRCAVLARLLAEHLNQREPLRAELCGLLLDCGKLVLEQKHAAAWVGLHLEVEQAPRLLAAERQTLGTDHIEAGVELLRGWQLEQDCIDALRYQACTLDEVLDATPLVRICWLARQLAQLRPEGLAAVQVAATRLFDLAPGIIDTLLDTAAGQLADELRSWGAHNAPGNLRQLSDLALDHFEREVREELQRLQWQLLSESALLALESLDVGTPVQLASVLARALQQADVEPRFVLLATQAGSERLQLVAGNKLTEVPEALGLQLQPGRSVLADCVLAGELALLAAHHERLTVIDRQVLELLGGSLLCEPVQTARGRIVLLLAGSQLYPQKRLLRAFIRRKLAAFLHDDSSGDTAQTLDSLLYRQRVREAVHEANNPLAIIKNYLQILGMKLGEGAAAKEIRIIHAEIDRVAGILTALRNSDAPPSTGREVDLNALLRTMHPMFAQAFGASQGANITLDLADDPVCVQASADALKQILTNLVKNAVEALDGGGNIVLSTRRNILQNQALYLQLSVADDGHGMSPEQLTTVFVAGTTTKEGEHRGSGLAIVKRLVDAMAGQINCQSDGKGTVISILLPQRP